MTLQLWHIVSGATVKAKFGHTARAWLAGEEESVSEVSKGGKTLQSGYPEDRKWVETKSGE